MTELQKQELRAGWLGLTRKFEPLDALGVALGSYFIYEGATDRGPNWLTIALGSVMVYIHSRRFFVAPQSADGLARLIQSLDLNAAEKQRVRELLT